ncbi:MAG: GDSL-type esterase/lipase family protein [Oscillospiraceae bacterium]|nr:GDSL-type esterase/lipase family protein [Oscillospiraceae bacterium]
MSEYIGRRIIPVHGGVWNGSKSYEELTIVLDEDSGDSYISRRAVPAGTAITDETYWMLHSLYSQQIADAVAQMEETESKLTERVEEAEDLTNSNKNTLNSRMDSLETRLDANVSASTDADADYAAEVVDARVDNEGNVYDSLGALLRNQNAEVLEQIGELKDGDIINSLEWTWGAAISVKGNLYTPVTLTFGIAKKCFPQGTKITATLFRSPGSCIMGTGTDTICASAIDLNSVDSNQLVTVEYTVEDIYEWIYFETESNHLDDCSIIVEYPAAIPKNTKIDTAWTYGYFDPSGELVTNDKVYCVSGIIEVPAMHLLTAKLKGSINMSYAIQVDSDGNFIRVIKRGRGVGLIESFEYVADETTYVQLCTKPVYLAEESLYLKISEVQIAITPYEDKCRVPAFGTGSGYIDVTSGSVVSSVMYRYSSPIRLFKGETIRWYYAGSSSIYTLSEWEVISNAYQFVQGLVVGDGKYHIAEYTADYDMYVRISAKVSNYNSSGTLQTTGPTVTEENFLDVICYYKELYYSYVANHILCGKSIALIGDSLAYGNKIGNDGVWLHLLALKYNMKEQNLGVNGNAVAVQSSESQTAMVERYTNINDDTDYIIMLGGANDKRLSVPIGDVDDGLNTTFKGALSIIIDGFRAKYPKAKLLFLTNYNRYPSNNSLGLSDIDYVEAMLDVCAEKCVPCFDNYHCSGVYFQNEDLLEWQDEGIYIDSTENHHLSPEAYSWIMNRYEKEIASL